MSSVDTCRLRVARLLSRIVLQAMDDAVSIERRQGGFQPFIERPILDHWVEEIWSVFKDEWSGVDGPAPLRLCSCGTLAHVLATLDDQPFWLCYNCAHAFGYCMRCGATKTFATNASSWPAPTPHRGRHEYVHAGRGRRARAHLPHPEGIGLWREDRWNNLSAGGEPKEAA